MTTLVGLDLHALSGKYVTCHICDFLFLAYRSHFLEDIDDLHICLYIKTCGSGLLMVSTKNGHPLPLVSKLWKCCITKAAREDQIPDKYIITPEHVFHHLKHINVQKAPGPDALDLRRYVCALFNASVKQRWYPCMRKMADTLPIPKVHLPTSAQTASAAIAKLTKCQSFSYIQEQKYTVYYQIYYGIIVKMSLIGLLTDIRDDIIFQ